MRNSYPEVRGSLTCQSLDGFHILLTIRSLISLGIQQVGQDSWPGSLQGFAYVHLPYLSTGPQHIPPNSSFHRAASICTRVLMLTRHTCFLQWVTSLVHPLWVIFPKACSHSQINKSLKRQSNLLFTRICFANTVSIRPSKRLKEAQSPGGWQLSASFALPCQFWRIGGVNTLASQCGTHPRTRTGSCSSPPALTLPASVLIRQWSKEEKLRSLAV